MFMYFQRNDMTNENQIITDHHINCNVSFIKDFFLNFSV